MEEQEPSNFTDIQEILGMTSNLEAEHAVSIMVALVGPTKPERDMLSKCWKFYRDQKRIKDKNTSMRRLHEN